MNNTSKIIDCYKTGDFNERIHLFLRYRDLRNEFTEIDMYSYNDYKNKNRIGIFRTIITQVMVILKK